MGAADFETAVQRLITQVGHWEAARWNAPAAGGGSTRAEAVRTLVQRLADACADAEQRRHRPVPRLADTVLPDQLRVMADDLLAADPADDLLAVATKDVTEARDLL
ncbi:hypothetical protein AB0C12_39705 [Actinoplanes sp. NPDC048967]|uniref:hypothetical protein n=1 Tax=Actinoplanes sp. NPDC048967 TaxID=3155269 RepID=UPI0033D444FC